MRMKCFAMTVVLILGILPVMVLAANEPRVIYGGAEIVYDVPPQIISGRTMVPIRTTIETITGQQMNWNENTKTLSFSANGKYITHTIGQKVVYADGSPVNFDTPSIILDNRTLVPVRMIAETSGCSVDWDAANRLVIITQPVPQQQPAAAQPSIISVTASKTTINTGDSTVLTVKTNSIVNNVWVDNGYDNAAASYQSSDTSGAKTWTVTCSPTSSRNITVYANTTQTVSNAASKTQYITIVGSAVSIINVSANKTTINSGESVIFTIRTNAQANNVWAEYDNTSTNASRQTDYSNGDRSWSVTISPRESQRVRLYANTSKTTSNAANETQYITVNVAANASVSSVSASKTNINEGDAVTITAKTNSAATYCWVQMDSGNASMSYQSADSSGNKTWTYTFYPQKSGTVTVYASKSSASGLDDSRSVNITVNSAVNEAARIIDYAMVPRNYYSDVSEHYVLTVETNQSVSAIYLYVDGEVIATSASQKKNGSSYSFDLDFYFQAPNGCSGTTVIVAICGWDSSDRNNATKSFTLPVKVTTSSS